MDSRTVKISSALVLSRSNHRLVGLESFDIRTHLVNFDQDLNFLH